jgi:hypothetical protein
VAYLRKVQPGEEIQLVTDTVHTFGRWRRLVAFALFALCIFTALTVASSSKAAIESPPPPQVWSDKADYAPGEQVTLSGANWAAGEAVHIRVNDDAGQTWSRDVDVTAADDGTISDQFNLPNSFVAVYSVTATGASSGTATWSFTDGAVNVRTIGVPSASVDWRLFSNATCTGSGGSSGTITATSGGNGTAIPSPPTDATQSLRLTAGTVTGFSFSQWSIGNFTTGDPSTANPVCLVGAGNTQNVRLNYAANTSTAIARTAGTDPSTSGDSLTFRATLTSGSPATAVTEGIVKFFDGGASCASPGPQIGADQTLNASGQASVSTTTLSVGSHTILACYQGTVNFGASGNSISQTVSPACTAPAVTTQPTNQTVTYGANATFTAAASGNPAPTVKWQVNTGSGFVDMSPAQTNATLTLTKPTVSMSGNQYRAVFTNTCGGTQTATSNSATLTVNAKGITITPDSGQTKVYGADDPVLTYTNTPPLESGDSFNGSLSRAGGQNVGSHAINLGTLSAGPNYSLALSATTVNFAITARPITVKANDVTRTYGNSTPAFSLALASGTFGYSDGVADLGTPTYGFDNPGDGVNVGTYRINVSGLSNSNYDISYATGTNRGLLTITARPITVKANDVTRTYGNSTPAFSLALASGTFGYSDGVADLGTPTYGFDNSGDGVNVGTYRINVSGLSNSNYDISYATGTNRGTLTIERRELTVKADNKSKDYDGSAYTPFTSTITGFASGENASVISGTVTYGGSAVGAVNAGGYTIVPDVSGLSASNYSFTAQNGTLTINKVALTVRADNKSKVWDGSPFTAFTKTITGFVNGENTSVISGSVTYSGSAIGATAVGTYTITPVVSGLSATNYTFTPQNGTLTIGAWNAQGYGFYAPVGIANSTFTAAPALAPTTNPGDYWNSVKGGSTVPLKFNVFAGSVEKTSLSDILSFEQKKLANCSGGIGEDPIETLATTGGTNLRYDTTGMQWIQNWGTPKVTADTCYRAWVTFADGSSMEAFFKLKK